MDMKGKAEDEKNSDANLLKTDRSRWWKIHVVTLRSAISSLNDRGTSTEMALDKADRIYGRIRAVFNLLRSTQINARSLF